MIIHARLFLSIPPASPPPPLQPLPAPAPPAWPLPILRLQIDDLSHPGAGIFLAAVAPLSALRTARKRAGRLCEIESFPGTPALAEPARAATPREHVGRGVRDYGVVPVPTPSPPGLRAPAVNPIPTHTASTVSPTPSTLNLPVPPSPPSANTTANENRAPDDEEFISGPGPFLLIRTLRDVASARIVAVRGMDNGQALLTGRPMCMKFIKRSEDRERAQGV
ncbi:hypothetical protein DXG01_000844 [Tephrocybe rancida]|nr:hypothetical protein DXG01_000844 [Tephrocybe rancida]